MRITREGGLITLRDRVGPFWFLGLFLLSGGVLGIAAPLGLAVNAGELEPAGRFTSLAIGVGVTAAALWYLATNPASRVQLDLARRVLTLVRFGLLGRQERRVPFSELTAVELVQGKDSDDDPIWRPAVRLRSGELVLLSQLWEHDKKGVLAGAAAVAENCRLPFSPPPA